jgi:glycosyltransferase involved in cell wall biosynthesis
VSLLSVIIPVRSGGSPRVTLESLARQTKPDFEVIVSWDERGNASWARNRGAELARSPYLLFADDDIQWEPGALWVMLNALIAHPEAAYVYGSYEMGGRIQCDVPFNAARLRQHNYISTMTLMHRSAFPGFDENIQRLQDWDLWLTMLEQGHVGHYCGQLIFRTELKNGITQNGRLGYDDAARIVRAKHNL